MQTLAEWTFRKSHFLRPFFGMVFLSSVAVFVTSLVCAQTQTSPNVVLIDETLVFSWRIVVLITISAVGYGGVAWSVNNHHRMTTIHLSKEDICKDFLPRTECDLTQKAIATALQGIKEDLTEIKSKL